MTTQTRHRSIIKLNCFVSLRNINKDFIYLLFFVVDSKPCCCVYFVLLLFMIILYEIIEWHSVVRLRIRLYFWHTLTSTDLSNEVFFTLHLCKQIKENSVYKRVEVTNPKKVTSHLVDKKRLPFCND